MAEFPVRLVSSNPHVNFDHLNRVLLRLYNAPQPTVNLTVTCDDDAKVLAEHAEAFVASLAQMPPSRWETLHLEGLGICAVYRPLLEQLQSCQWPNLKHLHLEASREDSEDNRLQLQLPLAPQLQYLTLNLKTEVHLKQPRSFIFDKLVSLELNTYTTSSNLLQLLSYTPYLQKCNLRLHGDEILPAPTVTQQQLVILPHLRHLILLMAPNINLLGCVMTPSLKWLHIEGMEMFTTPANSTDAYKFAVLLSSFIHSHCRMVLTHLKLVRCPLVANSLLRILRQAPALQDLRVWWGPTYSDLDGLATDTCDKITTSGLSCPKGDKCRANFCTSSRTPCVPNFVPRLEHLEIYLHPSSDPDQQAALHMWGNHIARKRRCAFRTQPNGSLEPLKFAVVRAIHIDNDESDKASQIEIGH